ncbi:MAG: hypothetical protein AB7G28_07700 [Pirellulales bacterium]
MNRSRIYFGLTLLVAAGCGGPANKYDAVVTGTVTINGELANAGTVTFQPVKAGKVAIGRIHPDGSYSLRTGQGDLRQEDGGTVEPGDYIVTVSITGPPVASEQVIPGAPPIPGASLVASKYAAKDTSDLKFTVKAGPQLINLELEPAEAPSAEAPGEATEESPAAETAPAAEVQPAAAPQATSTAPQAEEPASAPPAETVPAAQPEAGAPAAEPSGEKPAQ